MNYVGLKKYKETWARKMEASGAQRSRPYAIVWGLAGTLMSSRTFDPCQLEAHRQLWLGTAYLRTCFFHSSPGAQKLHLHLQKKIVMVI